MRVTIIHWRPEEAADQVAALQGLGFEPTCICPQGGNLKAVRDSLPDAYIIDLSRLPSHGVAVASELRKARATRHVPIIFADGLPEKVERARSVLPDALFCSWDKIAKTLRMAPASVPAKPVAPGMTGQYAATTVAKKLGITAGCVLTVLGAPDEYPECLDLPPDVTIHRQGGRESHRVLLFVDRAADLEPRFGAAERSVGAKGNIWIIWPKQSSGVATDVTQGVVREFALERDWVDYKVCAVDKIWSGFLFGRKRK